jgi:arylformamidase
MDENQNSGEQASKSEWIDISSPLRDKMPYGHPKHAPRIQITIHPTKDKPITLWELNMKSHTGTHIDAPRHLIPDGITIDQMPLDVAIGPARVIEIKDPETVKSEELEPYNIRQGERILLKTRNSSRCYETDELVEDFVHLSLDAAYYLAEKKVAMIGIDYVAISSIADFENTIDIHTTLFKSGVWILEEINLSGVEAGNYDFICLPLRLKNGDAAPARAVLRPL